MRVRRAVRAIVVAPDGRALLLCHVPPDGNGTLWLPPGGGVNPGESAREALRREVWEETGLEIGDLPPLLLRRKVGYELRGQRVEQRESVYLVRSPVFEPTAANNPDADERDIFLGFRWWSAGEMRASGEAFGPANLADIIEEISMRTRR